MSSEVVITKHFTFEAAHVLPRHPGKCSRVHGHSWALWVSVIGPVDEESGFVVDYGDLKKLVNTIVIEPLDHSWLGFGDIEQRKIAHRISYQDSTASSLDIYPSSENIVKWIGESLIFAMKGQPNNVRLFEVGLKETCTSEARWRPGGEY